MSAIRPVGGLAFCSIISKNYLAAARTLVESIRTHHPGAPVYVLVLDPPEGYFRPDAEPFTVVTMEQLGRADTQQLRFQYSPFELSCAAKPWLVAYLLREHGHRKVAYFDTDILVLHSLRPLARLLDHHPIILTPHLTDPYADDKHPGELSMSRSGAYNMGFFAVARGAVTDRFLTWWGRRLERDCLHAVDRGLFVDQKWADLIPGLFEGTHVLRDPGYNVAYWNLHTRRLSVEGDAVRVNGGPCYFYHFSGYDPDDGRLSRFQDRFELNDLGDARVLFDRYRDRLRAHGHPTVRHWPYTWNHFDNKAPIPEFVRSLYHGLGSTVARFGDPFDAAAPGGFFRWLTTTPEGDIAPFMRAIYDSRADVRAAMPDLDGKGREAFRVWWREHGLKEYQVYSHYLAALAESRPDSAAGPGGFASGRSGPVTEAYGINILGFLQSEKGMGEACRSTVRSAAAEAIPCALNNWTDAGSSNRDTTITADFRSDNPFPVNVVHLNAIDTPLLAKHYGWYFEGRYNIGYWNWELDWVPDEWDINYDLYDEVWVPSAFTRTAFARRSPIPVYRIPYAVTVPPPRPSRISRARLDLSQRAFVFFFAFDFASYFARKNPIAVVEAFRRAFGTRRDVVLLLKPLRTRGAPARWAELLAACQGQPNIRLFQEVVTRDEMYALLRLADAYVSLHRSEGFGLPLAEAMALGKPVVATNYSANVDFMDDSNSFPVRYELVEIDEDHGPYRKGAVWADPDVDHAAEQMRWVVGDPDRTARIAARARADIERTLNPAAVGRLIRDRLDTILAAGGQTVRVAA